MDGGRIQIYTGNGKGKTSAALGLLLRFLGSGGKVCLIQFDKGSPESGEFYSERNILRALPGLTLHATGCQRFDAVKKTFRFENNEQDLAQARQGLALARQAIQGGFGLVVLDEILSLVMTKLVERAEVLSLLEDFQSWNRPCELVLTGHVVWPELVEKADLITEMRKRKHYFDKGEQARKGIEY